MDLQELLNYICVRESEFGCYDSEINGVSIYSIIRRDTRTIIAEKNGLIVMNGRRRIDRMAVLLSSLKSVWHLCKLILSRKKYSTVFIAFPRVDKIRGVFFDKFTDPIIDQCGLNKDDYLIFDHGFAGKHLKPRIHGESIIFWDFLHVLVSLYVKIYHKRFCRHYKGQFDMLLDSMEQAFGVFFDKSFVVKSFLKDYTITRIFKFLLKHVSAKQVIGPARPFTQFLAAKQLGIKTMELQHGITYGETELYSGYRDPMLTPDLFLAFGENRPLNVYGIDESNIINIGWALNDYILSLQNGAKTKELDVLVVSDPEVSEAILNAVVKLAEKYPLYSFYVRPHPHESLSERQNTIIEETPNIHLQDRSINVTEVMAQFMYVIGENSTVLYEALSNGKKVGKLFFDGLSPLYLQPEDKECFWEIHNVDEFRSFLDEDITTKRSKRIYSPFDKEKFLSLLS